MAKRKYQIKDMMDPGTPELSRKYTVVPKLASPTVLTMKILDGTEVDKMLLHDVITPAEHGTLNTLAKKLLDFGYSNLRSPNYESPIHADPSAVGDKKAETIMGAVQLIDKMDKKMGRFWRKRMVNLALYDAPWGDDTGKLKECIKALDDIFMKKV